jgi:non-ribosomal peptide synthase protein (TIGR01720 family)
LEGALASIWAEVLHLPRVGIHDNFFELGGDSILSMQIVAEARRVGINLTNKAIFTAPTIARLAELPKLATAQTPGEKTAWYPLTPIQRWLCNLTDAPSRYNQSMLIEILAPVSAPELERALHRVVQKHEALRLRLAKIEQDWMQTFGSPSSVVFNRINLTDLDDAERAVQIDQIAAALQLQINVLEGEILRAAWIDIGKENSSLLLLIVNHMSVDGVSWRLILGDLSAELNHGLQPAVAASPVGFGRWADISSKYSKTTFQHDEALWAPVNAMIGEIDMGVQRRDYQYENTDTMETMLSRFETEVLSSQLTDRSMAGLQDVVLAAIAQSWSNVFQVSRLAIEIERHGRTPLIPTVDFSDSVGWFTAMFPIALQIPDDVSVMELAQSIHDQLECVPDGGLGYGIWAHTAGNDKVVIPPILSFNFLGRLDKPIGGLFRILKTNCGDRRRGRRWHCVDVNAMVIRNGLVLSWTYDSIAIPLEQMRRLSEQATAALKDMTVIGSTMSLGHELQRLLTETE